ncbi:MAG: hypothetical protein ACMZ7B_03890 [Balneola sp.]
MKYILWLSLSIIVFLPVQSQESNSSGLFINTNINDHFLIVNNDFENAIRITNSDTVYLEPGKYRFKLASPYKNDYQFEEEIYPDSITNKRITLYSNFYNPKFSSYPALFWKANLMIFSEEGADIFINNTKVGVTGSGAYLKSGLAKIRVENDGYSKTKNVLITSSMLQTYSVTTLPIKRKALLYSLIPSASQFYKDQDVKGGVLLFSFISASTLTYFLNQRFLEADKNFLLYEEMYRNSENPVEVFQYALLAEKNLKDAKNYADWRNKALIGIGVVYLINLTDGLISKPERGFFKPWSFNPYIDFNAEAPSYYGFQISKNL